MPLHRSILFSVAVASLAMAILAPSAALAFACYVGEAPTGPVILRAQPDDKAKIAEVTLAEHRCVLAFPLTYMNESGQAVGAMTRRSWCTANVCARLDGRVTRL